LARRGRGRLDTREEERVEAAFQLGEVGAMVGKPPELAAEVVDVAAVRPVAAPALGAVAGPVIGVDVQRRLVVGMKSVGRDVASVTEVKRALTLGIALLRTGYP
jgi:hypothetical protein